MYYFWVALWFIASIGLGFSLDARTHGTPIAVTSQHCSLSGNSLTNDKTTDVPCTATEQDYGWPVVVRKTYTNVATPDGIPISTYQTTLHVGAQQSGGQRRVSPNMYIAMAANAVVVGSLALLATWHPRRKKYRGDTIHL